MGLQKSGVKTGMAVKRGLIEVNDGFFPDSFKVFIEKSEERLFIIQLVKAQSGNLWDEVVSVDEVWHTILIV